MASSSAFSIILRHPHNQLRTDEVRCVYVADNQHGGFFIDFATADGDEPDFAATRGFGKRDDRA